MSEETYEDDASLDEDLDDEDLGDDELDDDDELDELGLDGDLDDSGDGGSGDGGSGDGGSGDESGARAGGAPKKRAKGDDDDEDGEDVVDLDEELHPDDVEVPLDALLKERTAAATLEDEEEEIEEEEPEGEVSAEGAPTRIVPRRPGEFLCSSCFLVLPRNQLQDEERMLCRDCA